MDYQRGLLLTAVDRTLCEATQCYEQRPTIKHARGAAVAHRLAAAAYGALASARRSLGQRRFSQRRRATR